MAKPPRITKAGTIDRRKGNKLYSEPSDAMIRVRIPKRWRDFLEACPGGITSTVRALIQQAMGEA